jgi:hypothetical protein
VVFHLSTFHHKEVERVNATNLSVFSLSVPSSIIILPMSPGYGDSVRDPIKFQLNEGKEVTVAGKSLTH